MCPWALGYLSLLLSCFKLATSAFKAELLRASSLFSFASFRALSFEGAAVAFAEPNRSSWTPAVSTSTRFCRAAPELHG